MVNDDRKAASSPQASRAASFGATERIPSDAPKDAGKNEGAPPSPLPTLSLPKGGGAIRGIGEKFAVNPVTGTGSLTVPIASSPGRSGFGPQLALAYDSGSGNGPFGLGFSLNLPTITRKTDKGLPRYIDEEESDTFILAGAEDLVPVLDDSLKRVVFQRTVHGVAYEVRRYRPRTEGLFSRIERWVAKDTGLSHWRTISRDNVTSLFGIDDESRIASPGDSRRIFSYLLARTFDDKGNLCVYRYAAEDGAGIVTSQANERNRTPQQRCVQRYLKSVQYGHGRPYYATYDPDGVPAELPPTWHFELVFDYGDHTSATPTPRPDTPWPVRPDPFSRYRATFEVRTYRRCRRVLMFHHFPSEADIGVDCLVRSTELQYSDDAGPIARERPLYSLVLSVRHTGHKRTHGGYGQRSLPPLEFDYTDVEVHPAVRTLDAESLAGMPEGIGAGHQFADLDGAGLPNLLMDLGGGAWGFKRNLSPLNQVARADGTTATCAQFGPIEPVTSIPSRSELGGAARLMDLSGSGDLDVVVLDGPVPGFFERTEEGSWLPLRTFRALPQIAWADHDVKLVDLTGDGRADVLLTEDGVFTFHRSLGTDGFDDGRRVHAEWDEERGPRTVHSDDTQAILLADMTGDGLSDLVRVRNGEVCYWPNIGYGRFGAKVTMDRAPWLARLDEFDPKRIRLADIDGTGATDLVYVGQDGVLVCFNQSGNRWAAPRTLAVFPGDDALSSVQACDLLGNGTACLVWSTALPDVAGGALRYVDVMGGQKPHLMIRTRNNLGAETRLSYAPSTKFFLADKLAGRPWITRLPHVVHVLERVEIHDVVSRTRFVTRYAYHHGHFDRFEREFRGFGMIERWDTEGMRDLASGSQATNWDQASWSPPTLTRTWFHTGAFIESRALSEQYEDEYWTEPALRSLNRYDDRKAMQLPDSALPEELSSQELHEAYRALKGMMLRTEVYAEDGSPRASNPYSVSAQNFLVRRVQPLGPNRHACFHASQRETVSFEYERRAEDPRVSHELTLAVDSFGNVLRRASVGYPRRAGHPAPEPGLQPVLQRRLAYDQTRLHLLATEHRFTNPIGEGVAADAYRAPAPCENLVAELIALRPTANRVGVTNLFRCDELNGAWDAVRDGSHDLPSEEVLAADVEGEEAAPAAPSRRVLERSRILYRRDDLEALLPLGTLESGAIAGESYRLAMTSEQLRRVFGDLVTEATLREGGYVRLHDDGDWWVPSGTVFYSSSDMEIPFREREEAHSHFFLARRAVDPFGAVSRVAYDPYDLLAASTTDGVGSCTSTANDYRVLGPATVTEPNGNRSQVAFDALGFVVATATMGKTTEHLGDSLAGFDDEDDAGSLQDAGAAPLANPARLLGQASARFIYDVLAYHRTRDQAHPAPPSVYAITREIHVSDLAPQQLSPCQQALVYTDGFGRDIQRKTLTSPDQRRVGPGVASARWIGSGWTIFDNKGNPVRTYEPFFSATHAFEYAEKVGVGTTTFYDPLGRSVGKLHPNATWEKIAFDGWRKVTSDANDTVLVADPRTDPDVGDYFVRLLGADAFASWYQHRISGAWGERPAAERRAAQKTESHADTPTVCHLDARGRTCLEVQDNGSEGRYPTRAVLDVFGRRLAMYDALDRRACDYFLSEMSPAGAVRYVAGRDHVGRPLFESAIDAGMRRSLTNVAGSPMRSWDARGYATRIEYDLLFRPVRIFSRTPAGVETLAERFVYGESVRDGAAANVLGRKVLHYDASGELHNAAYDFKGNPVVAMRRVATSYRESPDWSALAAPTEAAAVQSAAEVALEAEAFVTATAYDALNRVVRFTTPDSSTACPRYDEMSRLVALDVMLRGSTGLRPVVQSVDYDAKGQRLRVDYANGTITTYGYDPQTFLLTNQTTVRSADGRKLQDASLTYDPVHNVVELGDAADGSLYAPGTPIIDGGGQYEYDAMYRLIKATGREHPGQQRPDASEARIWAWPHPNDSQALRAYTEQYEYNAVGSLVSMLHRSAGAGWRRTYQYASGCNVLASTGAEGGVALGTDFSLYGHDAAGNCTSMPHLPAMEWDFKSRLCKLDLGGGGKAYYVYDSAGQRVRKVVESRNGVRRFERLYLHGLEIQRDCDLAGAVDGERQALRLSDDRRLVAVIQTQTVVGGAGLTAPESLVRYQLCDHVESSVVEADQNAALISYEEYHPYGTTAFRAGRNAREVTLKPYRFAGKERDGESGLQCFGARYYAAWLARWVSFDPALLARQGDPGQLFKTGARFGRMPGSAASEGPQVGEESHASGAAGGPRARQGAAPKPDENGYRFALASPLTYQDVDGRAPVPVGHVYVMRGTWEGEAVTYTGSTAQELLKRVGSRHKWNELVKAETTTVTTYEVGAELNVAASGRGTFYSARNEALRSAEQKVLSQVEREEAIALNEIRAATPENAAEWARVHKVSVGEPKLTLRGGVKLAGVAVFALLDAFTMWRDEKMSHYGMAPYLLEDEGGVFTLAEERENWFAHHFHWKVYQSGPMAGQKVDVSADEWDSWRKEGELLWGTTDFWGDFVPGLLRPKLRHVVVRPNQNRDGT